MALKVPNAVEKQSEFTHLRPARLEPANDAIDGSIETIRGVFLDNYDELIRHAHRRVDSTELAQDVVQQAFANTLSAVERGVRVKNMKGFLHRCVHNLCVNHSLRQPHFSIEEEPCETSNESTEACVELRAKWHAVSSIVNQLAPAQRDVFVLAELKGHSNEEIAEKMNRSVNAVRQLLYRARRDIRANMGSKSEWAGISIPTVGLARILDGGALTKQESVTNWLKIKFAEVNSWLGGLLQRGPDTLVQPQLAVAAGVVIVALATVASPPLKQNSEHQTGTRSVRTQESNHSSAKSQSVLVDSQTKQAANIQSADSYENGPDNDSNAGSNDQDRGREHGKTGSEGITEMVDPEAVVANDPPTVQPQPDDTSAGPPQEVTPRESETHTSPGGKSGPGNSSGPDTETSEVDPPSGGGENPIGLGGERGGQSNGASGSGQPASDDTGDVADEPVPNIEGQSTSSGDNEGLVATSTTPQVLR